MNDRSYSDEAKRCRELAAEFEDSRERPFLLGVAEPFKDVSGSNRPKVVIGPLGELMTLENLPAANTARWTPRRKAEVVAAVAGGLLTVAKACQRYAISVEEFASWRRAVELSGLAGLCVTRAQQYRHRLGD
jgi:hypothetical protein